MQKINRNGSVSPVPSRPRHADGSAEPAQPSPAPKAGEVAEARALHELSPQQWKSGIAAWLGWLFDGLDMHLYTLVAAPFVAQLLHVSSNADPLVKRYSSWIQAAFLIGWAVGGGFFGRLGDLLGRSRALGLTILTYALFTGLSSCAQTWWQLLIFRFLAALGIGGEWAVGSSLLAETWPKRWQPWIAAVLQTGVNLGVLLACLTVYLLAWNNPHYNPRYVFLVGILPALIVFWIRRSVTEPEEWREARKQSQGAPPRILDLFRGEVLGLTLKTILICSLSLTAWWAFLFWSLQHLRNLPDLAAWSPDRREQLVSTAFSFIISISIGGNFFAGALAKWLGYRRGIALMFLGFFLAMIGAYQVPRAHESMMLWMSLVGFFSGVFGLFTMCLPPLFPTLLRTTGAGFCYNIGRVAAALGTVFFGLFSVVGDFRKALWTASFLLLAAAFAALLLPESPGDH
jgi:predicted MFS family arabinose efflux permease